MVANSYEKNDPLRQALENAAHALNTKLDREIDAVLAGD